MPLLLCVRPLFFIREPVRLQMGRIFFLGSWLKVHPPPPPRMWRFGGRVVCNPRKTMSHIPLLAVSYLIHAIRKRPHNKIVNSKIKKTEQGVCTIWQRPESKEISYPSALFFFFFWFFFFDFFYLSIVLRVLRKGCR